MEAVRESWTDERLDLLNERVEERFDVVESRSVAGWVMKSFVFQTKHCFF